MRHKTHNIRGSKLKIKKCLQGNQLAEVEEEISKRRVYVKNIPFSISDRQLIDIIEPFGEVELCYICKERRNTTSKTDYGFITFKEEESAQNLLEKGSLKLSKFKTKLVFRGFKSKGKEKKPKHSTWEENSGNKESTDPSPGRRLKFELVFDQGGKKVTKFHSKVLTSVSLNHTFDNLRFNE